MNYPGDIDAKLLTYPDIDPQQWQAFAFETRTNGRERIQEMGLSNEQVAEQLIAIYQSLV